MNSNTVSLPSLDSFGDGINAAVIGASGGIGHAFARALAEHDRVSRLFTFSRKPDEGGGIGKTLSAPLDLEDEASIESAASLAAKECNELHLVVVATGILHDGDEMRPEKTWRHLSAETLERAFRINAVGPALAAKHFLPLLDKERKSVFAALSARVGSIEDNRFGGWYAYRASKAALNMLIKTSAVELARHNKQALCVGLHPGTVDTALSQPFQGNVPEGKLFAPDFAVAKLLGVLDELGPENSGNLFAWDGARIPF